MASILVSILERVDTLFVTHLVLLPHAFVPVSVAEAHNALARPLPIQKLSFVNIAVVILQNADRALAATFLRRDSFSWRCVDQVIHHV